MKRGSRRWHPVRLWCARGAKPSTGYASARRGCLTSEVGRCSLWTGRSGPDVPQGAAQSCLKSSQAVRLRVEPAIWCHARP